MADPIPVNPEALDATAPFPDCGHKDWTVGCERCFWEATNIAKGNLQGRVLEDQTEGAIMFASYMILVFTDMADQCVGMERAQLDLNKQQLARDLAVNIGGLIDHTLKILADPAKMHMSMEKGAAFSNALAARTAARRATTPPAQSAPKADGPLIKLTDVA